MSSPSPTSTILIFRFECDAHELTLRYLLGNVAAPRAERPVTTPILDLTARGPFQLERLVASRCLIQANSGGGKSWALRYLLEQTHGRIPHLVIDSEGEFSTLREKFDYVLAGRDGDVPADPKSAKLLCRRLVEIGASAVIDLYDLKLPERRRFVKLFLDELMHLPRALWHPILVVIDEAHRFCPERGSGDAESTDAVITLCTQGRKRGYAAVLATQRLSKLHKDAAAELLNVMIGRTGLDVDAKRAGDILGMGKESRNNLRDLEPGEFFCFGPAIAREVVRVRTGAVKTTHPEPGKIGAVAPPPPAAVKKLLDQMQDLEGEAAEEERTIADLERRNRDLQVDLGRARKASDPAVVQRTVDAGAQAVQRAVAVAERAQEARISRLEGCLGRARTATGKIAEAAGRLLEVLDLPAGNGAGAAKARRSAPPEPPTQVPTRPPALRVPVVRRPRSIPDPEGSGLAGPHRKIVNALALLEDLGIQPATRSNVAVFTGYAVSGGAFANYLGSLRNQLGLIDYPRDGELELTDAGRALADPGGSIGSLEELHETWYGKLTGPQVKILREVIGYAGTYVTREQLAESTGYEASGGAFANYLGALRSLGLVDYPGKGLVAPADLLFPRGLS